MPKKAIRIFCSVAIAISLTYCGGKKPSEPDFRPADILTAEGWSAFEAGDFELAAAKFDSAQLSDPDFVDAYNGAGWAYAYLKEFSASAENFENAIDLNANFTEAHAGASLTYHARDEFDDAIAEANTTLTASPNFVFSHDSSVDALDIRITLALSYFSTGDFVNAAAQMDVIDPQHLPHSTQPEVLIKEIMRFFGQLR